MPPRAPLRMAPQYLAKPFTDDAALPIAPRAGIWTKRACTILPAFVITTFLTHLFASGLSINGLSFIDVCWIVLLAATLFWLSFVMCLSALGLFSIFFPARQKTVPAVVAPSLNVAVLIPVFHEDATEVFANILAMQDDLRGHSHRHNYSFFVLSDSQAPKSVALEARAFDIACANKSPSDQLYYRRREDNEGYKIGNISQWIRNWGGRYDAALILDADSLMNGDAVLSLTNRLAQNPATGLVQGSVHIFRGQRLFARLQQFSSAAFGRLPGKGLEMWSGNEGNFFGHNAIFRIKAFAACACLPKMPLKGGGQALIYSHDFVEAALLRRAGWGVELMADIHQSYEQAPETLIDYIRRDQRWCQGNMQHLRICTGAGLHPVSRFHMVHNALGYLMAPAWCIQILIWIGYSFNPSGFVPGAGLSANHTILASIFAMLLLPKFAGAFLVLMSRSRRRAFGGGWHFSKSFCMELIVSTLVTPTIMIHQTKSIIRSLTKLPVKWDAPLRQGGDYDFSELLRFHKLEVALGFVLFGGMMSGLFSIWTLPISISLTFAPVISHFSGYRQKMHQSAKPGLMTPQDQTKPAILVLADGYRNKIHKALQQAPAIQAPRQFINDELAA